ncbi:hypothetical protein V5N11_003841 [Cardamine amara subsp. amara]|uniref:S-protein homolog n=1 Tax=Cardamine amara subsp. amara TaxID=228776 RepID=A0ABD1C7B6_CARAN
MEKILICVFFFFLISIQEIDSILVFRHFNIEILNHLGGNKRLMFNCRENGGSTAVEFLSFNASQKIYFRVYPQTLIWCNLWKGPDFVHRTKFDAFVAHEGFIRNVCGGRKPNVCLWEAEDSGIWVRNNKDGVFNFMYRWDTHEL